ncbi:uncharacterized protein LOC134261598 [Saccostrea cucullata]|uniref:uncharacterized protein LOC134261598 n=1 Tax=Saccostrea cuccullata TaxID=36930 RepID=UPI002ED4193E
MKTLREIFDDSGAAITPYNTALKVKICGLGQISTYRNASGEQTQSLPMGIADRTMAAKGMVYDVSKASSLKVASTVMLLNVIIKRESRAIVMTNRSKLLMTGPFAEAIPAQLVQQGLELACPPPSELVAINKIKSSTPKSMVSIRGQVVSEEIERTAKVNGEDTLVRSLKIKDETASCKVSLWRGLSKTKTAVGSHLEITNVIVQVYNDEKSVSTTSRSKMLSSKPANMTRNDNRVRQKLRSQDPEDIDFVFGMGIMEHQMPDFTHVDVYVSGRRHLWNWSVFVLSISSNTDVEGWHNKLNGRFVQRVNVNVQENIAEEERHILNPLPAAVKTVIYNDEQ